jgi:hypothetical protein
MASVRTAQYWLLLFLERLQSTAPVPKQEKESPRFSAESNWSG